MSVRHVLELCDRWDRLSKGESPTTKAVREALAQDGDGEVSYVQKWITQAGDGEVLATWFELEPARGTTGDEVGT